MEYAFPVHSQFVEKPLDLCWNTLYCLLCPDNAFQSGIAHICESISLGISVKVVKNKGIGESDQVWMT